MLCGGGIGVPIVVLSTECDEAAVGNRTQFPIVSFVVSFVGRLFVFRPFNRVVPSSSLVAQCLASLQRAGRAKCCRQHSRPVFLSSRREYSQRRDKNTSDLEGLPIKNARKGGCKGGEIWAATEGGFSIFITRPPSSSLLLLSRFAHCPLPIHPFLPSLAPALRSGALWFAHSIPSRTVVPLISPKSLLGCLGALDGGALCLCPLGRKWQGRRQPCERYAGEDAGVRRAGANALNGCTRQRITARKQPSEAQIRNVPANHRALCRPSHRPGHATALQQRAGRGLKHRRVPFKRREVDERFARVGESRVGGRHARLPPANHSPCQRTIRWGGEARALLGRTNSWEEKARKEPPISRTC